MGVQNKNSTPYVHPDEPNLLNLHKAMTYDDAGVPHVRVFLGTDTINIAGDVNLVDKVKLWDGTNNLIFEQPTNDGESGQWSIPTENYNMVFNGSTWDRMRGNINDGVLTKVTNFPTSFGTTFTNTSIGVTQSTTPWKISANTTDNASNNPIYVNIGTTGTVSLSDTTLTALEHVSIDNFPTSFDIGTMPEVEIKNDNGNPISISKNSTVNSASNRIYVSQETDVVLADSNYTMNVARGLVTGQYVETKNGYVTGLNQDVESTIWGEAVTYPWSSWTTAQKLYVISTSASDTGQSLYIDGLDGNFNKITEIVTTNGLTAVATSQNFLRINHCYLIAGNTNVGKITQRLTSGTGTVVGSMAIGFGRIKGGFFTVPLGYTAYIMYGSATQFRGGAGNIGGVVKMYTRTPATPVGPFLLQYIAEVVNGQFRDEFAIPLAVPQKTDIDVRMVADGNGTQATCAFQMIMIPN